MARNWRLGLAIASIAIGCGVGAIAARVNVEGSERLSSPEPKPAQLLVGEVDAEINLDRSEAELRTLELPPQTAAIVDGVPGGLHDPPRGDVRIAIISDLNGAYGSTDYDPEVDKGIALIPFWNPDFVLSSGDMVAGQNPRLTPEQIRAMWEAFDLHIAAPLREWQIPLGFSLGNHDASNARNPDGSFAYQTERKLAADYWRAPSNPTRLNFVDRDDFPFYYTFELQGVFVLVWDGSSSTIPPDKLDWVENALSSPAARAAKLRIVVSHLPLYAVAAGRNSPGEVMNHATRLQAMLEQLNVHTYISGHHHAYYPGHRGNLQLLHAGILGAGPRPLLDSNLPPNKTLTIVDIQFDDPDLTTYTTYDMRTLEIVQMETLPRVLVGHNGEVLRRDVQWGNLTDSEQALCRQRLGERCGG